MHLTEIVYKSAAPVCLGLVAGVGNLPGSALQPEEFPGVGGLKTGVPKARRSAVQKLALVNPMKHTV